MSPAIGGIVGNLIPIPIVGALLGALAGNAVGKFVGGLISKHILKDEWKEKIGQFALRSLAPGAKQSPKEAVLTLITFIAMCGTCYAWMWICYIIGG